VRKHLTARQHALRSRDAIDLLSNKWRITVLSVLRNGPLRTGDIQRALREVSPKVLTETLRGMERDGLINRRIIGVVPPHVEYGLTDMGRSLLKPLRELCLWAQAHVGARDEARSRFDLAKRSLEPRTARAMGQSG
jgi:DNA-binding HxlR family transcriptional regulator